MDGQPDAPLAFTAPQKVLWKAITTSRPASAWTPSDALLLKLYVEAYSDVDRISREIKSEGEVVDGRVSPLVKIRSLREQVLLSIGMKLKLMPSNRFDGKAVQRLGDHAAKARGAARVLDADDLLHGIMQ